MRRLRFRVKHHGRWFDVELTQERLRISVDDAERTEMRVHVQGRPYVLAPGELLEVKIVPEAETPRQPATVRTSPSAPA
jgi:hypothetical protein